MISTLNQSLVSRLIATAVFLLFLSTPLGPVRAQPYDPDDEIDQTVARISFIQGPVSYGRGDDPDDWDPALVNVPFTLGDRIYSSAEGRAELQLPGGNFIRIGRRSYLTALTLTYDTKQFYLGNGAATINLRRLDSDDIFEIDTPNVAVTLDGPGRYRIEVDENGDTRVIARSGRAIVAANGRELTVERAEMRIYGIDRPEYELVGLRGAADEFDRWVDDREGRYERRYRAAYQYADEEIVGADDLADYGRWEEIPEYGQAWTPTQVAVGWQPFTVGHWFWQDPWGWTWISEEPWGWAPCHYGRWTFYRSRWYWVPVRRRVEVVRYAPAVVEIVYFGGHVGWFPLHPRDRFVPWWGRRGRVEEITYVNRTRVVVVNETTFVSSRRVSTSIVRDTTIIRESTTVRTRERLPIPRRESIRVVADSRNVQRPPANIVSRPVVVRTAPTAPPPKFDDKLRVIRERGGQPLTTRETVELGAKDFKSNRRIQIKAAGTSRGEFVARGQGASAPATQPVTSLKGRKLATPDDPVVTDLPRKQQREQERRERQVQEQQRKDQDRNQKQSEQEKQKQQKQLQDQQRKDQRDLEDQKRDLERKQQEQDRLKKDQERDRQKDQKQLQEQQKKDQEQDRLKKQQERDREKDQKQLQEQQKKDQERDRRELERKQQDEERLKKQQEQDRQKQEKQLEEQKRKNQEQQQRDLERQKQDQERERQKQLDLERRKNDEQKQREEQERRKQLQDEQQKQRQIQQDQKQQEQERRKQLQDDQKKQEQRRQELERKRLEKKPQDVQKEPEKQGREQDRQRQQDLREAARQRQLQERKAAPGREQPPPEETSRGRGDRDAPPPGPPPPGPPPR